MHTVYLWRQVSTWVKNSLQVYSNVLLRVYCTSVMRLQCVRPASAARQTGSLSSSSDGLLLLLLGHMTLVWPVWLGSEGGNMYLNDASALQANHKQPQRYCHRKTFSCN